MRPGAAGFGLSRAEPPRCLPVLDALPCRISALRGTQADASPRLPIQRDGRGRRERDAKDRASDVSRATERPAIIFAAELMALSGIEDAEAREGAGQDRSGDSDKPNAPTLRGTRKGRVRLGTA